MVDVFQAKLFLNNIPYSLLQQEEDEAVSLDWNIQLAQNICEHQEQKEGCMHSLPLLTIDLVLCNQHKTFRVCVGIYAYT